MISPNTTRRIVSPWLAAGFCAVLSLITICGSTYLQFVNHTYYGEMSALTSFLCFLPICFYFVGIGMRQMRDEIRDLRAQIEKLQNN